MSINLDSLELYNHSYLLGLLKKQFPNTFDIYLRLPKEFNYPPGSLIYLDDEMFHSDLPRVQELFTKNRDQIFIVKIKKIHELAKSLGVKSVLFPWWHVVDDCIALNLISKNLNLQYPSDTGLSFNCFNRRIDKNRRLLIEHLRVKKLIDCGWVTGHNLNRPGLKPSDLGHFVSPNDSGYERHFHKFNDVSISTTVLNIIHINHQHHQPINIAVETRLDPFFPTEKSFLAFSTKKIPIILAETGRISQLKAEGFDMFDDIVNHDYDSIINEIDKTIKAVDLNRTILEKPVTVDDSLLKRLDRNWNYLIFEWTYAKLNELQDSISRELG